MAKFFVGEPFSVSLIADIENVLIRGGGVGRDQDFPSKYICLTVPKKFVWEPFRVSLVSGTEKSWESEGEEVSRFCVEGSWSHSAEKIRRRESSSVSFI